ncbi:tRNA pseudouridine(55) synthase TruB [Candidatus Saccharibacteria bacterium]|nr:tRNA pseudouridine(55) synthase TruB [Candidatus Saccharibacteria bacterium]
MEDQIILVDKPAGISSFGAVAKVRARLRDEFGHKVKVGHTGTLDPFATGLLILLSGKMTKKSGEFLKLDKVYEAEMKLGFVSSTGDPEGEITEVIFTKHGETSPKEKLSHSRVSGEQIQHFSVEGLPEVTTEDEGASPVTTGASDPSPKRKDVEFILKKFIGEIEQTPPKFSAIKINGQRAYKLARKGQDFEIPSRKVTIYDIKILEYDYPMLKIRCHVSSGTYIRTLAEDIGKALGTGAYLTTLRRTKIGDYDVKHATIKLC